MSFDKFFTSLQNYMFGEEDKKNGKGTFNYSIREAVIYLFILSNLFYFTSICQMELGVFIGSTNNTNLRNNTFFLHRVGACKAFIMLSSEMSKVFLQRKGFSQNES